jgi:hypothetical protein
MYAVGRRAIAGVAVAAAVAGGAVIARADDATPRTAAAAERGLGISPMVIEKPAARGAIGSVTVSNHSSKKLAITVKARPWTQSSSGDVSLNRRRTLSGISVSDGSFDLAAGAQKKVDVTSSTSASMYGGIEVIGIPDGAEDEDGVVVGYRLISTLRLNPATPDISLKAGTPKVTGKGKERAAVLPVKNSGNTIEPVKVSVSLKGALGTRRRSDSVRVLPGKTVNVLLGSGSSLKSGSYTATVKLTQGGKTTTVTKKLRVKK